jgi:uncharacterized damage-inducible protein DinB
MHEPIIDSLAAAPGVFADLLARLPADALFDRPASEEWSIAEILGHVRAADAIWTPRILFGLVHDGVTMPDVDERALQDVLHASGLVIGDQVTAFAFGRAELCGILRALTEDEWSHVVEHAERGAMTIIDACTAMANHEAEHLGQARAVADAVTASFER